MSVLETPRLYFRGKTTFDPIVTNNRPQQYDEDDSKTVFGSGTDQVAAFRKAAIAAVSGGNWNVDGTHRSIFYETTIVGVDTGSGRSTADPLVNCPVGFAGMLVDLDPYGGLTSQLFFDAMSFGVQGGCQIFAPRTTRVTARYINFARNTGYGGTQFAPAGAASVVWQTSFPKQGLRLAAHYSPVIEAFAKMLQHDDMLGLTVRWNAYRTLYFDSLDQTKNAALAQQLQNNLTGGGFQPDPARSEIVGVLGLWRKGEPACEPGDRALLTKNSKKLGSAYARLAADSLTLDLSNSIPETGVDLTKQDIGEITAVAVGSDGKTVVAKLGTFGYSRYNREAYDATAGIVVLKVDPSEATKAQTADLQLRAKDGTALFAETALRAVPAVPNVYLEEGKNTTLAIQVLDRGNPAGAGIAVAMVDFTSSAGTSATNPTDAGGIARFALAGTVGEVEGYMLVPGNGAPIPTQFDQQLNTYVYVRTWSADEDIARLQPTWDNVHKNVLRNWQAMAPCMDNWLDLGNPDQVKSFASVLRRLTDLANFESFRFMPVTRDMTAGERTLLYKFLDGKSPLEEAAESAPAQPSVMQMSRALRGG